MWRPSFFEIILFMANVFKVKNGLYNVFLWSKTAYIFLVMKFLFFLQKFLEIIPCLGSSFLNCDLQLDNCDQLRLTAVWDIRTDIFLPGTRRLLLTLSLPRLILSVKARINLKIRLKITFWRLF